jgi:hypothetical protein
MTGSFLDPASAADAALAAEPVRSDAQAARRARIGQQIRKENVQNLT